VDLNLNLFFERYENVRTQADDIFKKIKQQYPDCVKCKLECSDCCHALFDITLIEALYINHHFNKILSNERRSELLELANRADRKVYKLKKKAAKAFESGESEYDILTELAKERVTCPLLNSNNCCELYQHRPITCRIYGIPTSIAGEGHTCGLSEFKAGESYPTVNLDAIQSKLLEISKELVLEIQSKHIKLGEILVPLSMALLTTYDESYLGIDGEDGSSEIKGN
jgi:Fe-S-cluster containining protein